MKINEIDIVIHTHNEAANIEDCIDSAKLLTETVYVIDMESTDNTTMLATKKNAAIVSYSFSNYVEPAREFGIKQTAAPWVFIMDADERMTQVLADEIKQAITDSDYTYYKIPRKNIFAHATWLRHGGWYPDYVIRLIKKSEFVSWPKQIHSTPIIRGRPGVLKNPIVHYFHPNLENMVEKTAIYEQIEAHLLADAKKKVSTLVFFRKFLGELNRRLILKRGFLDGTSGLIESIYQAFSKTITYIFLYEKYKKSSSI